MNIFETIFFCIGIWCAFWTILGLITPTRAERLRNTMWDHIGRLADRLGIQLKNEKDE